MCACELDGAWGGSLLSEVLRHGGLQLVITEVVPVGGGADNNNKSSCAVRYLSGGDYYGAGSRAGLA